MVTHLQLVITVRPSKGEDAGDRLDTGEGADAAKDGGGGEGVGAADAIEDGGGSAGEDVVAIVDDGGGEATVDTTTVVEISTEFGSGLGVTVTIEV